MVSHVSPPPHTCGTADSLGWYQSSSFKSLDSSIFCAVFIQQNQEFYFFAVLIISKLCEIYQSSNNLQNVSKAFIMPSLHYRGKWIAWEWKVYADKRKINRKIVLSLMRPIGRIIQQTFSLHLRSPAPLLRPSSWPRWRRQTSWSIEVVRVLDQSSMDYSQRSSTDCGTVFCSIASISSGPLTNVSCRELPHLSGHCPHLVSFNLQFCLN